MENRRMVPCEKTIQETTTIDDGITAQQNANHDNDNAHERQQDDTPGRCEEILLPRNKLQAQWGMRNQAIQEHAQRRRMPGGNKKRRRKVRQESMEDRNRETHRQTPWNSRRTLSQQRGQGGARRDNVGLPATAGQPRTDYPRNLDTEKIYMRKL